MEELSAAVARQEAPVGLIVTRGYLHSGHAALVHAAHKRGLSALLCVFLSHRQFGPGEDFALYPRDGQHDLAFAEEEGVDILWTPAEREIYPLGVRTELHIPQIEKQLANVAGPEVLRDRITTAVRMIGLSGAKAIFYGEQDWYKAATMRMAVRDLAVAATVETVSTRRAEDGLAVGATNERLRPDERQGAGLIYRALRLGQELFAHHGEVDVARLLGRTSAELTRIPGFRLKYVRLCDPQTLAERPKAMAGDLLMAGGYFGRTRVEDAVRLPEPVAPDPHAS